jgi:hypothetical protein
MGFYETTQLQLEQVRERRDMEAIRQAQDERTQSEVRELTEQNRCLMAMASPKKWGRDFNEDENEA